MDYDAIPGEPEKDASDLTRSLIRGKKALQMYDCSTSACPDENLVDLLTDLMLLADATGLDFEENLDSARMHFDAETDPMSIYSSTHAQEEADFQKGSNAKG